MAEKEDPIMKGIKNGEIYGMTCEPLKDSMDNLRFCPIREECQYLQERMSWINEMENLIVDLHCGFCQNEKWLFVGITKHGTRITATMDEEYAKKLNKEMEITRK